MDTAGLDWNKCRGDTFEIYHRGEPGFIRSGDMVALHYPMLKGTWLNCKKSICVKGTCPGNPNPYTGFSDSQKWIDCFGEVFRIYARNKVNGIPVNSDDVVALFYQQGSKWVSQGFYDAKTA